MRRIRSWKRLKDGRAKIGGDMMRSEKLYSLQSSLLGGKWGLLR